MKVDSEKTKRYYSLTDKGSLCDCAYCKNYRLQIKETYPKVASYLASLGIDIEKPFETSPLEVDENGFLEYCVCQYIILGTYNDSYSHKIDDVELQVATSYPSTGLEEDHFVIEFYSIKLKVTLPL